MFGTVHIGRLQWLALVVFAMLMLTDVAAKEMVGFPVLD